MNTIRYYLFFVGTIIFSSSFSQKKDSDSLVYVSNESLLFSPTSLHKNVFKFIDISKYKDVYLVQTLGGQTSLEYYFIGNSVIEKLQFNFIDSEHWDFIMKTISKMQVEEDKESFSYEINSNENRTCSTQRWIQHIHEGEIISSLLFSNYSEVLIKKMYLPITNNFVHNIEILEQKFDDIE